MTELDQIWSKMLDEAASKAGNTGREHVAEYLRLRATNDVMRSAGVEWLFDTVIEIAGRAVRDLHGITMERQEPHNFPHGNSNMVGSRLEIRLGVRCLTVEAGWARTPADGIMRNGALAFARITHFGMPKNGADLRLIHTENLPNWLADTGAIVNSHELRRHFEVFLG